MLNEDVTETSWEEHVSRPNKEILLSDLAKPSLDILKDMIRHLPPSSRQQKLRIKHCIRDLNNILDFFDRQLKWQVQSEKRQADLAAS